MNTTSTDQLKKLEKENKRLKTTNLILLAYVIMSVIIMLYNYFL